ncbi:Nif3-like dinuclear metal center hexameric protein [Bdellovibrionota bacterium FG-2]
MGTGRIFNQKVIADTVTVGAVVNLIEARAPAKTAERWDNVGLLVGDGDWRTKGAVISIDLTAEAIAIAKQAGYNLILTHHPCIFPTAHPLSRVTLNQPGSAEALVFAALRAGIAVVCAHTNFDQCALEVVEAVSKGLGVTPQGRLHDHASGTLAKLVVFVPETHAEKVRSALGAVGAGHIGRYDQCTFGARGEGTFRGGAGTDPFVGRPGVLEKVNEIRLETVFPRGFQRRVMAALFESHPYEEVAYDLYSVEQGPSAKGLVSGLGYGFWGDFPKPKPFSEILKDVTSLFKLDGFWMTDLPLAPVLARSEFRRVAFVAGKGASFVDAAKAVGCDLFITGEVGYHGVLAGARQGISVLEMGHRESELFFLKTTAKWLKELGLNSTQLNLSTQRIWSGGKKWRIP